MTFYGNFSKVYQLKSDLAKWMKKFGIKGEFSSQIFESPIRQANVIADNDCQVNPHFTWPCTIGLWYIQAARYLCQSECCTAKSLVIRHGTKPLKQYPMMRKYRSDSLTHSFSFHALIVPSGSLGMGGFLMKTRKPVERFIWCRNMWTPQNTRPHSESWLSPPPNHYILI